MSVKISEMIQALDDQVFEPDADMLAKSTHYGSFEDRMKEAERDYEDAKKEYDALDGGSRYLVETAVRANEAGRVLMSRALAMYHKCPSSQEEKERVQDILDRLTKDASMREQDVCNYYHFMQEHNPNAKDLLRAILKEKQNVMKFFDRCVRTQSLYIKKFQSDEDYQDPIQKSELHAAIKAEKERRCVPDGSAFRPPMPFPPERIPEDQDVPPFPKVYSEFQEIDPEEKVFNVEHQNFELPEDYKNEDGSIDGDSIKFDYENHLVTMKYRNGVPVTWKFKQFIDTREVPDPNSWFTEYYLRLWDQANRDIQMGVLQRNGNDYEVPEYDKKPSNSQ